MNIKDGKDFPQKRVTMVDVAKVAGVSKSTVSLVLNGSKSISEEKQQRVNEACKALGYVYNGGAASLRGGRSKIVAVLSNNLTSLISAKSSKALSLISITWVSFQSSWTSTRVLNGKISLFRLCEATTWRPLLLHLHQKRIVAG